MGTVDQYFAKHFTEHFAEHSITLIRHGPPTVSLRQRVRGHQFRQFVARYDAAEIAQRAFPPLATRQWVAQASVVFASPRPRARHTVELLGVERAPILNPQFREIEFPVDFSRHFKFSAFTWSVIGLVLWRMGYSHQSESLAQTRSRACVAADLLEQSLEKPLQGASSVVLIAHGGINRLIAQELRKRGWAGPRMPHSEHWGCTTYFRR
jgi:broad specificity phosphatase PhoE